jgi:putative flippase GtrA
LAREIWAQQPGLFRKHLDRDGRRFVHVQYADLAMAGIRSGGERMIPVQAATFFLVGLVLTVIDIGVFRTVYRRLGWNRYIASTLSTGIALSVSLVANRYLVFRPEHFEYGAGVIRFLTVSLMSAWGLQNFVLWLLEYCHGLRPIFERCLAIINKLGGSRLGVVNVVVLHKITAICCGVIWNFCWYRWWVFV